MNHSNQTICHICFSPLSETMIRCNRCGLNFHPDTCGGSLFTKISHPQHCKKCKSEKNMFFQTSGKDLEHKLRSTHSYIEKLQKETDLKIKSNMDLIDEKTNSINEMFNDIEKKLFQLKLKRKSIDWIYVALLCAVFIPLTGWLVYSGWANNPDVTIDFSIGEIIGGILIGGGAIIAGTAYSKSISDKDKNDPVK
ncbi:hypothetical protein MQE36_07790 [Zhouia spongiae]|uniref:RING-type domain-containing protein n=1 Tax=Zhouia spongiae TaxID=2202721 RepID=A0ABY3YUW2_9FLAO|nr:hypothetical protein [Zhouia spongiae]UNZ00234.1 hypothetical protein MQE36_07790 [Zhouia spongiae]